MYFNFQSTFRGKALVSPIDELVNSFMSNNLCKVLSSIFGCSTFASFSINLFCTLRSCISSIDILVLCFTSTKDWDQYLKIKEELAMQIKEDIEQIGLNFAFPSQSIYIEKN